jgi:hypothetical protein
MMPGKGQRFGQVSLTVLAARRPEGTDVQHHHPAVARSRQALQQFRAWLEAPARDEVRAALGSYRSSFADSFSAQVPAIQRSGTATALADLPHHALGDAPGIWSWCALWTYSAIDQDGGGAQARDGSSAAANPAESPAHRQECHNLGGDPHRQPSSERRLSERVLPGPYTA